MAVPANSALQGELLTHPQLVLCPRVFSPGVEQLDVVGEGRGDLEPFGTGKAVRRELRVPPLLNLAAAALEGEQLVVFEVSRVRGLPEVPILMRSSKRM
jgi:hypothetical protein